MRHAFLPLTFVLVTRLAAADGSVPVAEALFNEASQLVDQGKYIEACPKFAESHRLDPQLGTLLNLADCDERAGKIASAWSVYTQLVDLASHAGDAARAEYSDDRAKKLYPRVPKIRIAGAAKDITELKLDGIVVGTATIGVLLPVDPGSHTLDLQASEGRAWQQTVLAKESEETLVTIVVPPPPSKPTPSPQPNVLRPIGIAAATVGVASIALGMGLGAFALDKKATGGVHCQGMECDEIGFRAYEDAHAFAAASTAFVIAGAIVTLAGVVVAILARPRAPATTALLSF